MLEPFRFVVLVAAALVLTVAASAFAQPGMEHLDRGVVAEYRDNTGRHFKEDKMNPREAA